MADIFKGRIKIAAVGPYGTSALFGMTRSSGAKQGDIWHGGIDITCPDQPAEATEVYAVESGKVIQSRIVNNGVGGGTAEWGNYVTIQGEKSGKFFTYAHLASRAVVQGQMVKAGEKIGMMGNTGNAANGYRHVHFEVRSTLGGTGVDPAAYLGITNAIGVYGAAPEDARTTSKEARYMYIKVCAEQSTTPRSSLVTEGWIQVRHNDGTVKMYNPNGSRYSREVSADQSNLSAVYEDCASRLQPGEILLAVG